METGSSRSKTDSDSIVVYEVLTMSQDARSWFVNDEVVSDGSMIVCTLVDPLFLLLPILAKSDKAKPLGDHLQESSLPKNVADLLSKHLSLEQLENIAIRKGCDDIVAFVYSEEKALTWLKSKAEKVAKLLQSKNISHAEASVSSNFVKVDTVSPEDSLRYACDIVGEYIDEHLKKSLMEKLNLPVQEKVSGKRKNVLEPEDDNSTNSNKKTKVSDGDIIPVEDYGSATPMTPAKNLKVTAREKALGKAAQGSHSLFKFFTPKSK